MAIAGWRPPRRDRRAAGCPTQGEDRTVDRSALIGRRYANWRATIKFRYRLGACVIMEESRRQPIVGREFA